LERRKVERVEGRKKKKFKELRRKRQVQTAEP
jgi:hypothetical protein